MKRDISDKVANEVTNYGWYLFTEGEYDLAAFFFRKAWDHNGLINIADYYYENKEYEKALDYYEQANIFGSKRALCMIGEIYERGLGVIQNDKTANENYQLAKLCGFPLAYHHLARMFRMVDEKFAFDQLVEGSKLELEDDRYKHSDCLALLSQFYLKGIGCEKNVDKCFEYAKIAADRGDMIGLYHLAYCYQNGIGTEKDIDIATCLYFESANKGYMDSLTMLSDIFEEDTKFSRALLCRAITKESLTGYLKFIEKYLDNEYDENPGDKVIKEVVARFNKKVFPRYDIDEYVWYNLIVTKYKDRFDWEDIENDPDKYISK